MSALLLGAVTNSGAEADESGLALLLLRLKDGVVDALKVTTKLHEAPMPCVRLKYSPVTIIDVEGVPAI